VTLEIDTSAENAHELIDAAIQDYAFSAARFVDGETVELWFASTMLELTPIFERMQEKPGHSTVWGKAD
jgi:hypothetical protein